MNVNFDLEEQGNENNGTDKEEGEKSVICYDTPANLRKLTLVLLNGERYLLDYADLSKVHYAPEQKRITLSWGDCEIILMGSNLETLFEEFATNRPRVIRCFDERYKELFDGKHVIITEIAFASNRLAGDSNN